MKFFYLAIAVFILCKYSYAQDFDNPAKYLSAVSEAFVDMDKAYFSYISAAAHSNRIKKIEKMRQKTLESINISKYKIIDLPIYKNNNELRQSGLNYVSLCYNVFNEDYNRIINMEEIAEQSLDEMEAYLLLQEKTSEKISEACSKIDSAYKKFAIEHNVTLIQEKSELNKKLETASKVNHYRNQLFLIFFKSNWQDTKIIEAINSRKLDNIEQSRNALIQYSKEGILRLDTLKKFGGDASLANACKHALIFYLKIAESELPKIIDHYIKEETFEKIKKSFEAKPATNRTKEDVEIYNKAINDINTSIQSFNQTNENINANRNQVLQNWNSTQKTFLDIHIP